MTMPGRRRLALRGRAGSWAARHPFVALSIGILVLGWLLIAEIVEIIDGRRTVADDWMAGLLAGVLAAAALTAVMTLLARRSRQTHKLGAFSVLILVTTVSVVAILRLTFTSVPGAGFRPTNWLEVASMSYVAVLAAVMLSLTGWTMRVYWRRRRSLRRGETDTPGWLTADRLEH
jgi:drug/metabolite transporter (DMT)-like permease